MIKFIGARDAEEMDRLVSEFSVENTIIDLELAMAANEYGFYLVATIEYRPSIRNDNSVPLWKRRTSNPGPSA